MSDLFFALQGVPVDPDLTAKLVARYGFWMNVSGVGELLWVPTYILLILAARRARTNTMPLIVLLLAIPLNFTFSFLCDETYPALCPHTPQGTTLDVVALWIWRLCLGFSLVLLWYYLKYGREQPQDITVPAPAAYPVIVAGLLVSFAVQYSFLVFEADFNGNQLYFLVTVLMSAAFVLFALARPDNRGLSYAAGWTRLASETLMVTGVVVITAKAGSSPISLYPGYEDVPHTFVYVVAASIVLLDAVYVAILAHRR
jgi:hypothetical protein